MQLISIAGLTLQCQTHFPLYMKKLFSDYTTDGTSSAQAIVTLDPSPWLESITSETEQQPEDVEFYALGVAMGEILPLHRRLQTHGVAISFDGKAYIFTAPSGIGKTTRAMLWQKYLGADKVSIINGDKPVLWFRPDGVYACGSPWAGKENQQTNICLPLGGICMLERSHGNTVRQVEGVEFFDFYVKQVQMPKDPDAMLDALGLLEELYEKVPVFSLRNDRSEEGVRVCFEALTGKKFEKARI